MDKDAEISRLQARVKELESERDSAFEKANLAILHDVANLVEERDAANKRITELEAQRSGIIEDVRDGGGGLCRPIFSRDVDRAIDSIAHCKGRRQGHPRPLYSIGGEVVTGEIFVFGSNLAGRHGKGAALHARNYHGAVYGEPVGPQVVSETLPARKARPTQSRRKMKSCERCHSTK